MTNPTLLPRVLLVCGLILTANLHAAYVVILGPEGSGTFGDDVKTLPNRNIVVLDENYDDPQTGATNVGAAHLYSPEGVLISTLKGSTTNDNVGRDVFVLSNGNYLIASFSWSANRGAVTFCSATTGCDGVVSAANSLVGAQASDLVGSPAYVLLLSNGNYVVAAPSWDNGAITDAGAVAWGSGTTGIAGVMSTANSLHGTTTSDRIGNGQLVALANGNYVVVTPFWDDIVSDPAVPNSGAVTFGNGSVGTTGAVSPSNSFSSGRDNGSSHLIRATALTNGNYVIDQANWFNTSAVAVGAVTWASGNTGIVGRATTSNSLIGSTAGDSVGGDGIAALPNGNYLVRSSDWRGSLGALSFADGNGPTIGVVSAANSLVGSNVADRIGMNVTILSDGDYVTHSQQWDNGSLNSVGAVTWGSGSTGVSGLVSISNSLVGSTAFDLLGRFGEVVALSNGNYVVACPLCDVNGIDTGGVILGRGDGSTVGVLDTGNTLHGSTAMDMTNVKAYALTNGNYVVAMPSWSLSGINAVGAVSLASGSSGLVGPVSAANSLIGSQTNDRVGNGGVTALSQGNYVVRSLNWRNETVGNAGAVTYASGTSGLVGSVSAQNSLVGTRQDDFVGGGGVFALSNGNYVVVSDRWNNGTILRAGASTFGSGNTGIVGTIGASNSFVGTRADDRVGLYANTANLFGPGVVVLPDGNYLLRSLYWDGPNLPFNSNVSAVTFGLGTGLAPDPPGVLNNADLVGPLTANNSGFGTVFRGAQPTLIVHDYNASDIPQRRQLVLGLPLENRVILLSYDLFFRGDFE